MTSPESSPAALPSFALSDYDFDLPEAQIAQQAISPRHASRLLVVDRATGRLSDAKVSDLLQFLPAGAVLVVNDTQVVPARLRTHKASGGAVELLLERPFGGTGDGLRDQPALARSSKALQVGQILEIEGPILATARVAQVLGGGRVRVDLAGADSLAELLEQHEFSIRRVQVEIAVISALRGWNSNSERTVAAGTETR